MLVGKLSKTGNAVERYEFITQTATRTESMTKQEAARFHYFNSNGAVALLPDFDDFCHGETFFLGCQMLYGRYDNYHAKQICEFATTNKRFTWSQLKYHVALLMSDAEHAKKVLAEKRGE